MFKWKWGWMQKGGEVINSTSVDMISQKQKSALREPYMNKKYLPLDLRPKKTRAIRRRLTKHHVLCIWTSWSFLNLLLCYSSRVSSFICLVKRCIFSAIFLLEYSVTELCTRLLLKMRNLLIKKLLVFMIYTPFCCCLSKPNIMSCFLCASRLCTR